MTDTPEPNDTIEFIAGLAGQDPDPAETKLMAKVREVVDEVCPTPPPTVEITLHPGRPPLIVIGGLDISAAVRPDGVRVRSDENGAHVVTLELVTERVQIDGALVTRVVLTEPAADTLIAGGWTPPQAAA